MSKKRKIIGAVGGIILAGAVTLGGLKTYSTNSTVNAKESEDTSQTAKTQTADAAVDAAGVGDAESGMIYLQADANGKLKKEDADAKNPVSVKVTYYLNDREMKPNEIAGKSGKIKIRFDYENLTSKEIEIGGERIKTHVPFMMISAVMLPADTFSNVKVSDGKLMEEEEQCIAVGTAFPGLEGDLQLDTLDIAKDIDLPDYVEITADVTEFELEFTANVMVPLGLSEMDSDSFDDVDNLVNSMNDLGTASDALVEGTGQLLAGLKADQTAMSAYTDGVSQLSAGIAAINQSLSAVTMPDEKSMKAVTGAATALTSDAAALSQAMTELQGTFTSLQSFAQSVGAYKTAVETAVGDANTNLANAQAAVGDIDAAATDATLQARAQAESVVTAALNNSNAGLTQDQIDVILNMVDYSGINITSGTADVAAYITGAQTALSNVPALDIPSMNPDVSGIVTILGDMESQMQVLAGFSSGMTGLTEGMNALTSAIEQLQTGSQQLTANNAAVMSGLEALVAGAGELQTGMKTFDEEGIQELQNLAGEDLQNLTNRMKAMREAEIQYKGNGNTEKDRNYVIETESIEMK